MSRTATGTSRSRSAMSSRARELGERLRAEIDEALRDVDVLVAPTTPSGAPTLPVPSSLRSKEEAWMSAVAGRSLFTSPFNISGHPALSVPCGFTREQLPVGLQVVGRHHRETDVLRVGSAYEALTEWHARRPPIP